MTYKEGGSALRRSLGDVAKRPLTNSFDRRAFERSDESADAGFYVAPRFVEHIDDGAIAAVTQLYRERIPAGSSVLDLMSSWVSHLPPERTYARVVGLGMNAVELARNSQLDAYAVHDLNTNPMLPFSDASFDAATICVSIQYLIRPVDVIRDLARVLRPGASLTIVFSNRCFPTKAIVAWRKLDDFGHCALVARYVHDAGGWSDIAAFDCSPPHGDPLFAVVANRASHGGARTSIVGASA